MVAVSVRSAPAIESVTGPRPGHAAQPVTRSSWMVTAANPLRPLSRKTAMASACAVAFGGDQHFRRPVAAGPFVQARTRRLAFGSFGAISRAPDEVGDGALPVAEPIGRFGAKDKTVSLRWRRNATAAIGAGEGLNEIAGDEGANRPRSRAADSRPPEHRRYRLAW